MEVWRLRRLKGRERWNGNGMESNRLLRILIRLSSDTSFA